MNEAPGEGLRGTVSGHPLQITSRSKLNSQTISGDDQLPPSLAVSNAWW